MKKQEKKLLFGSINYKIMLFGIFFMILGFLLMSGGGSDDPNVFSDDIFSFQRIRLAPILIVTGYIIQVYAILKSPEK
tara:strand:- start:250 stop:483 length:234 start_codon:yes stop_codon:yes gene_type:complete